jgi:hypothetical protein
VKLTLGLTAALLVCAATAHAQDVSVGVKAGFNLANVSIDDPGDIADPKNRTAFVAGLFVTVPAGGLLAFQPEVLFSMQGSNFNQGSDSGALKLDYVQVPLLARIKPAKSPVGIVVGPALAFRTRAKLSVEGEDEELDFKDQVKGNDVGFVAGVVVDVAHVVLDGRYTWGLKNIAKDPDDGEVKNRVFSLTLGFRF